MVIFTPAEVGNADAGDSDSGCSSTRQGDDIGHHKIRLHGSQPGLLCLQQRCPVRPPSNLSVALKRCCGHSPFVTWSACAAYPASVSKATSIRLPVLSASHLHLGLQQLQATCEEGPLWAVAASHVYLTCISALVIGVAGVHLPPFIQA